MGQLYITWNWVTIIGQTKKQPRARSGRLFEGPPSGIGQQLGTTNNNNYGREAAAFLKATICNIFGFSAFRPQIEATYIIWNWVTIIGQLRTTNYGRSGRLFKRQNNGSLLDNWEQQLELGNNWEQQLRARSGRLFKGKNGSLLDNWEQQLGPRSGRLLEFFGLLWITTKYGREADAFLKRCNWHQEIMVHYYVREAAAFLSYK